MDAKQKHVEALFLYTKLFEEVFDQDEDYLQRDNWDDYENVIKELQFFGAVKGRNTCIERFEELRNELPFEKDPDWERDTKQDR